MPSLNYEYNTKTCILCNVQYIYLKIFETEFRLIKLENDKEINEYRFSNNILY